MTRDVPDAGDLRRAVAGFAHGERYDRARPGYPDEGVRLLIDALGVGPGSRVLDLAAGTGKLTRHLVDAGADVVAVEPTDGMRSELEAGLPLVGAVAGVAEAIPLPSGAVDAVTVAQAFHWFDGPAALREIHRVLAPGGSLGLIWNVMDRVAPWVHRLQALIHEHRGDHPWYWGQAWRAAFDDQGLFGPLEHRAVRNVQIVDEEGLVARVASVSFVATLDPHERASLLGAVRALAPSPGRFEVPYRTDVFWSRRID